MHCRYQTLWDIFLPAFCEGLTAAQRRNYNIARDPADRSRWKLGTPGILAALRAWPTWQHEEEQRQQQQQEQRNRSRQQANQIPLPNLASNGWLNSSRAVAETAAQRGLVFSEVTVDGMRFVGDTHARAKQEGWALLKKEEGSDVMWFFRIKDILQHTDWSGESRVMLYGSFHKSARAHDAGPLIDPALDSPIFKRSPSLRLDFGMQQMCLVPAERVAPVRIAVLPHLAPGRQAWLAALTRDPMQLCLAGGYPLPQ
jgi:hypothetical protein